MTHTVQLHRVLRAPPERIFRAFTQAAAFARWLTPFGFTAEVFEIGRASCRERVS
jgi:uncharacterized protein YndB with AHSA1/START domain